jgi:hypothetical protein
VRHATTSPNSCTAKTNTEAEADSCTAQAHAEAEADSCTAEAEADSCTAEAEADSCTAEAEADSCTAEADSCAAESYTCWVQDEGGGLFVVSPVLSRASLHRRPCGSNHLPLDAHNETC